ncbi:MAG: RluA family pseudouridine synthase [Verrucomicrobiales bacterium]|nr:RluA family pseudouridine synthase [Verrucomicrobiales bacterium]
MSPGLPVTTAATIQSFLIERHPDVPRTRVKQWLRHGAIHVNGSTVTRHDHPLQPGDRVEIRKAPAPHPATEQLRGLTLIHEDADLLIVEKPAGLLSIAAKNERERTAYALLTDYVRTRYRGQGARVWIVHRLDLDTSGLMVFARTEEVKRRLQADWSAVAKDYLAITDGHPPADRGRLEHQLDESDPFRVRIVPADTPDTRHALTHYQVLEKNAHHSLLELRIETGRRHQIRVQLAAIGCPVLGDSKYHPDHPRKARLALHASRLSFRHPRTQQQLTFESPLPAALRSLFLHR